MHLAVLPNPVDLGVRPRLEVLSHLASLEFPVSLEVLEVLQHLEHRLPPVDLEALAHPVDLEDLADLSHLADLVNP